MLSSQHSLNERGFCTKKGKPTPKSGWAYLDVEQLILLYSGINRGIQNYYRFADNWAQVQRIQYILHYSLAMTLGRKFKISTPKVFKRFGKTLSYTIKDQAGVEKRRTLKWWSSHCARTKSCRGLTFPRANPYSAQIPAVCTASEVSTIA